MEITRKEARTADQAAVEAAKPLAARSIPSRPPEAPVEETREACFSTMTARRCAAATFTRSRSHRPIGRFCRSWNQHCQPSTWTKPADEILAKLNRQTTQRRALGRSTHHLARGINSTAGGFTFVDSYRGNLALQIDRQEHSFCTPNATATGLPGGLRW
jgi:hypothetical protein